MKTYKFTIAGDFYELESLTCDRCKKTFDDLMEMQEFHFIDFVGGYASIFGDGTTVECDLCQHCLHFLIADSCKRR